MAGGPLQALNCGGCGAALTDDDRKGELLVCRFCGQTHAITKAAPPVPPQPPPPSLIGGGPMGPPPTARGSAAPIIIAVAALGVLTASTFGFLAARSSPAQSVAPPPAAAGTTGNATPGTADEYTRDASYEVGEAVLVWWGNKWWDGHIKEAHGDEYRIGYDGWADNWDETVPTTRLQKKGDGAGKKRDPKRGKKRGK